MPAEVTATPAAPAAESAQTTPPPATPPPPPKVELPVEEYQRLVGSDKRLADIQRQTEAAIEKERNEKIKATTDKEELARLLDEQKKSYDGKLSTEAQRYTELEQLWHGEIKTATIAQSLAGHQFVSQFAAQQAQTIIDAQVEITRGHDGKPVAVDRITRRPAADVIAELLKSEQFSHFLVPANPQGGAGQQGNRVQQAKTDTPPDFTQQVANEYIAAQSQWPSFGLKPRTK